MSIGNVGVPTTQEGPGGKAKNVATVATWKDDFCEGLQRKGLIRGGGRLFFQVQAL